MKKLSQLIIAILLFHLTTLAQEDWFWVNPQPQGNNLRDVFVLDENTIIAVGERGTLLRSENGGAHWDITYRLSDIEEDIVDIQFLTAEKGYLLANDPSSKILLTEDKGINWKVIAEFDLLQLKDLFFIDENIGWAIGCSDDGGPVSGMILKSIDGGHTWDTIYVEPNIIKWWDAYSTIQFIDNENGWAAGCGIVFHSELLRTTDGGENWSVVYNGDLWMVSSFQFLSSDIGWLTQTIRYYSSWSELIKTTDGGLTWATILTFSHDQYYLYPDDLYFINSDTGWIRLGNDIHKTTDGGLSWLTHTVNIPNGGSIHFGNELSGCIVSNHGGILTTQNGGQSWTERSTITIHNPLHSVDFYNESIGWITTSGWAWVGHDWQKWARICQSIDGCNSWVDQLTISSDRYEVDLSHIQSISDQVVYAAGTGVFKTSDGGMNWNEVLQRDAQTLYFLDEETGFVGSDGLVFKTIDGGTQWDTVLNVSAESIFFTSNSTGWLASGHNIYKTSDEGNNWHLQWTNISYLKSICFRDGNVGLAVGYDGAIIQTIDGGSTWDEIWNKDEYELKSVCFTDSNKAVVVGQGNGGGIIVSIDNVGGAYSIQWESWTPGLNDVYFLDQNNGWAVGDGGTIIKTGSGATFVEEEEIDEIPSTYFLSNNFPNPFNPNTKIKYSIPQTSQVQIKVFDVLGNEIETLVNEEKPIGTYEITWNAENLPSGVYFYQLTAGSFIETKKMVLMK